MNDLTNLFEKSRVTRTFAFDREGDEVAGVDESGNVLFHVRHRPLGNFGGSTSNLSKSSIGKLPQIETLEPYLKRLFEGARVIVYNKDFEIKNAPNLFSLTSEVLCVMERAAHTAGKWNYKHGSYEWVPLIKAIEIAKLEKPDGFPHRAVADAQATMALWHHLEAQDNHIVAQHFPERQPYQIKSGRS